MTLGMTYVVLNPCIPSKSPVVRRVLCAQIQDKLSNMSMTQVIGALRDFFRLMGEERKYQFYLVRSKFPAFHIPCFLAPS